MSSFTSWCDAELQLYTDPKGPSLCIFLMIEFDDSSVEITATWYGSSETEDIELNRGAWPLADKSAEQARAAVDKAFEHMRAQLDELRDHMNVL